MRRVALGIVGLLIATACTSDGALTLPVRVRATPMPTPAAGSTPQPPDPPVKAASVGLERFDGCRTLLEHLRSEALERVGPYGLPGEGRPVRDVVTMGGRAASAPEASAAGAGDAGASGGTVFSGTNIQEAGVDEPDIVKTDGRRLVAVARGRLHVLTVDGQRLQRVGSVELPGGWGHELLLAGDRALVLATDASPVGIPESSEPMPSGQRTTVSVVDLGDVRVVFEVQLEGSYVSARLSDGIARVVLRSQAGANLPFDTPGAEADAEAATRHNQDVVAASLLPRWLPRYAVVDPADGTARTGALAGCESTYRPAGFSGLGLVTVVSLDPADPTPRESTSVLADASVVYASTTNLYVATTEWPEGPVPLSADVAVEPPPVEETEIHRFDISDPATARYAASGAVPGGVLNQWSLSEHDGHLRVATTLGGRWGGPGSESVVTVLDARGEALVPVGSVGGLGRDERIYAVRFMGDTGYVVTFRQVDPLYVLDLSDPADPRATGELKIPGYSAYLHPVGEGLLLGVGQDATEEGRALGTQVSLFDVADPRNPTRLHNVRVPDAHSEVEGDHHAFLWWGPERLALVPVQVWNQSDSFSGAVAYAVGRDGIAERARLSHDEHAGGTPGGSEPEHFGPQAPIRRSIVVGDALFTVSELGIEGADIGSLTERSWLAF